MFVHVIAICMRYVYQYLIYKASCGFNAITNSWQCLAVYKTLRKSLLATVILSIFLTKPFTADSLISYIRIVLNC